MTITRTRSPIFDNAQNASYAILNEYRAIRSEAGNNTPFALRVIDTQNLFSAKAFRPVEAARLREAGEEPGRIRTRLEQLASSTYGYLVPRDLYYIRNRARAKGDRSVSLFSAALGTALDIKPVLRGYRGDTGPVAKVKGFDAATQQMFEFAARRVAGKGGRKGRRFGPATGPGGGIRPVLSGDRGDTGPVAKVKGVDAATQQMFEFAARRVDAGLLTPTVAVCYGGELDEMRALPGYTTLRDACGANNIEMFESVMSLTGMVNVGKGAVVVGFAAEAHEFGKP